MLVLILYIHCCTLSSFYSSSQRRGSKIAIFHAVALHAVLYILPLGSYSFDCASRPVMVPTCDASKPEDKMMHNITVSSEHNDFPRSHSLKVKSHYASQLGHPVTKPWQKLPQEACSVDAVEGDNRENLIKPVISSQYSHINVGYNDPSVLGVTRHSDQYILNKKYANLDDIKKDLPQADKEMCMKYLNKNNGNIEQTKQDLKVHILMEMNLENANMESCHKALGHCQWKLDRAAEWLIEQNRS